MGMGIAERKEREKLERKAFIIRCAKDLILDRGVEAVSMQDIAQKAELSKATLYLYFSGKDELLREICEQSAKLYVEFYTSDDSNNLTALEKIKYFWSCFMKQFGKSDDIYFLINMAKYIAPETSYSPLGGNEEYNAKFIFYNMIKELIADGIKEKIFEPDTNCDTVTRSVLVLFSGVLENAAGIPRAEPNKTDLIINEIKTIFEIILRGITCSSYDKTKISLA